MSFLKKIVEHFHLNMNPTVSQKDIIPFLNREMNGYGSYPNILWSPLKKYTNFYNYPFWRCSF